MLQAPEARVLSGVVLIQARLPARLSIGNKLNVPYLNWEQGSRNEMMGYRISVILKSYHNINSTASSIVETSRTFRFQPSSCAY